MYCKRREAGRGPGNEVIAYLGTVRDLILLGISFSDLDSNASSQLHKRIIIIPPDQQNHKYSSEDIIDGIRQR